MNTQEFVEDYVKAYKAKFFKFFVIQLILDVIEMAAFVFAVLQFIDNNLSYVYISIAVFVVVLNATLYFNMRTFFGSFKEFVKGSNIYRSYNDAVKDFQNSNDKATFDEKLSELEQKIKEKE